MQKFKLLDWIGFFGCLIVFSIWLGFLISNIIVDLGKERTPAIADVNYVLKTTGHTVEVIEIEPPRELLP